MAESNKEPSKEMIEKDRKIRKEIREQAKEFEKWENSVDGISYDLHLIGDPMVSDTKFKLIIIETLKRLPKRVRRKSLRNVLFIMVTDGFLGLQHTVRISKYVKADELGKTVADGYVIAQEQPIILLNFTGRQSKKKLMDMVAHEIAHFILEHGEACNSGNPSNERKADNLAVKWGFGRSYNHKDYAKIEHMHKQFKKIISSKVKHG